MATRQLILQALRGWEASRIRFTFAAGGNNITINRATFDRVARAIEGNVVHVTVSRTFPAGVGALYHSDTNTIETPPVIGRADLGLVLHESTHAFFDLASTGLPALDDEAAAYVVDALYFRMTGLPRPRWNARLHSLAGTVAATLLHHYAVGDPGIPTVEPVMWTLLRVAIITDPVYTAGPAGTGGTYMHTG